MEDPKKIIICPQCGTQLRFPSNKHIQFSCTNCEKKFEYKNGEQVVFKKIYKPKLLLIILISIVLLFDIKNLLLSDKSKKTIDKIDEPASGINFTKIQFPDTSRLFFRNSVIQTNNYFANDSSFDELLKKIEDKILEKTMEKIFDAMTEEIKHGHWEKADKFYYKTKRALENSNKETEMTRGYKIKLDEIKNKIDSKCTCLIKYAP